MKTITIHSLQAILPMMLLPGILLSAEPENKNNALPPGTQGARRRPDSCKLFSCCRATRHAVWFSPTASKCAAPYSGRASSSASPRSRECFHGGSQRCRVLRPGLAG